MKISCLLGLALSSFTLANPFEVPPSPSAPLIEKRHFCEEAFTGHTVVLADNLFGLGVDSDTFVFNADPENIGRQHKTNWCWAACIQMVLNYHGVYDSQESEVYALFDGLLDRPAMGVDMMKLLNSRWREHETRGLQPIRAEMIPIEFGPVMKELEANRPLIVGLVNAEPRLLIPESDRWANFDPELIDRIEGHAYVLTGVSWSFNPVTYQPEIHHVVLRNPWPKSESRMEMSWAEFKRRADFAISTHVGLR